MFTVHANNGFQITFLNGITISVMFSYSHYTSTRDLEKAVAGDVRNSAPDAEVTAWNKDGSWLSVDRLLYDSLMVILPDAAPQSSCSPKVVAALLYRVSLIED